MLKDSWELPDGTLTDMWVMELYRPYGDAHHSSYRASTPDWDIETYLPR